MSEGGFGKEEVEWTEKAKGRKAEFLEVDKVDEIDETRKAIFRPTPGFKRAYPVRLTGTLKSND